MGYENTKKGLRILEDPCGGFTNIPENMTGSWARMLYLYLCGRSADTKTLPRHLAYDALWPNAIRSTSCDNYVPLPPRCVLDYPRDTLRALGIEPSPYNTTKLHKAALVLSDNSLVRVIKTSTPYKATLYQLVFHDEADDEVSAAVDRWVNHEPKFKICCNDDLNTQPSEWHLELRPEWVRCFEMLHEMKLKTVDALELRRSIIYAPWRDQLK